jgi:pyruvate formate lyase activating enzyme
MSIFSKEAPFYNKLSESRVQCGICPRFCLLNPGERSYCGLYVNVDGKLFIEQYGALISCFPTNYGNILFHPQETFLTVQLPGCNSGCGFCWYGKNYTGHPIENVKPYFKDKPFAVLANKNNSGELSMPSSFRRVSPAQTVDIMTKTNSNGLHFAVVEPSISLSWVHEAARLCHEVGGVNLLSTSGFLSVQTTELLSQYIDSVRLSFKSNGDKDFYRKHVCADSKYVFDCAKTFRDNGVFVQICNSFEVGAGLDKFRDWARWVIENLGSNTPVAANPLQPITFQNADEYFLSMEQIAKEEGLRFFQLDERPEGDPIVWKCPDCQNSILTEHIRIAPSSYFGVNILEISQDMFQEIPIPVLSIELGVDFMGKCLSCGCQTPIKP